jgi:hypothetical protein
MEQLKVSTNNLPSVVKKKVTATATLVSSTEAFPTTGLALQLEESMVATSSILGRKVEDECWNSGLNGRLEAVTTSIQLEAAVAATSEAARLLSCIGVTENNEVTLRKSQIKDTQELA